jgi:hypothetical protein
VLRFWDNDVLLHTDDVMQAIFNALHGAPHPAPAEGGAGSKRIVLGCDPAAGCRAAIERVLMCAFTVASPETGAPAPRFGAPLPVHTGRGDH